MLHSADCGGLGRRRPTYDSCKNLAPLRTDRANRRYLPVVPDLRTVVRRGEATRDAGTHPAESDVTRCAAGRHHARVPADPSPPRVRCVPRADVVVPRADETLLDAALRSGVPLASSCGGRAVCGDCLVRVVEGADALTPPTPDELAWRVRKRYDGAGRLACCVRARGDCAVTTTYW